MYARVRKTVEIKIKLFKFRYRMTCEAPSSRKLLASKTRNINSER